ncbi:FxLYD domain-containing protein [bacterium]|nr:FxLYD domain-containing protein [bacterium]
MKIAGILFLVIVCFLVFILYFGNDEPATCLYMSEETAREMGLYQIIYYDVQVIPGVRGLVATGRIKNNSSSNLKYVRIKLIQYEEEARRTGEAYFPVNVKGIKPGETGDFEIEGIPIWGMKHYKSVLSIESPASRIYPWKFG